MSLVLAARWWWPWPPCTASPKRCDKQSEERSTRDGGKVIWLTVVPHTRGTFAVTSGKPVELDVALVVNGVSDRRKCAQHRLPELKACGMLLQSIDHRRTPVGGPPHFCPMCMSQGFVPCLKGCPKGVPRVVPRGGLF